MDSPDIQKDKSDAPVDWEARYHSACQTARNEAARHDITTGLLHEAQRRNEDWEDLNKEAEAKWKSRQRYFLKEIYDCESVLARALEFPAYQTGEPGYSPNQTNYITGAHTAVTLAMEAEGKLDELREGVKDYQSLESRLQQLLGGLHDIIERERNAGNQSLADELSKLTSRED